MLFNLSDSFTNGVRETNLYQKRTFVEHWSKGGGSNPCSTILLQILYDSKGLFGNINLTLVEDSFPYAICIINHLLSIKVISHEGGIASSTIGKPCSAKTDEFQKKGEGGNFLKIPLFWQSKASLRIFTSVWKQWPIVLAICYGHRPKCENQSEALLKLNFLTLTAVMLVATESLVRAMAIVAIVIPSPTSAQACDQVVLECRWNIASCKLVLSDAGVNKSRCLSFSGQTVSEPR